MKKWKVLLVVLCAMLASLGLFACKSDSGEDITTITRVTGASGLSYTDNDTWNDVVTNLQSKVKLTCKPAKGENFEVAGSDCEFTSTIALDGANHCKIGNYTIRITPKENNSKNVSREVDVEITHAFAQQGSREVCDYCGATRTTFEESVIVHYGNFHNHGSTFVGVPDAVHVKDGVDDGTAGNAYLNNKANESYIKQFGTVEATDGVEYTIPTLTVGRLEPGMTITVKGTAKTAWSDWGLEEDKGYYFPVIGFADRYLNTPVWEGAPKSDYKGGGTSVFVRGEGWVLYNGVDSSHADATAIRMLSALGASSTGSGEGRNYGSHELATPESGVTLPSGYVNGQVPDIANWTDWVVYSIGSTSNTTSYSSETELELTWNYREDGVIELIYNVNGSKLIAMVKVPAATMGYYDTMLHGDYVSMNITSYERIETRTPKDFSITVSKDNYYEGQTFKPSTVSAKFKYEQTGDETFTQALSLENFYATTATEAEITAETKWDSLASNPVSTKYNTYMVKVTKGGEDWIKTFTKNDINVVANVLGSVYGGSTGSFKNNNAVGELALGTDGTIITLTPTAAVYGQSIPSGASWTNGSTTASHRFVSLKLDATAALSDITAVKSGNTDVPYFYDKANGYLVLALTADTKTVTVEGLQTSKTVFDFSEVKGFNVEATIALDTTNDGWKLNYDKNVATVTFKAVTDGALTISVNGSPAFNTSNFSNRRGTGWAVVAEDSSFDNGVLTLKIEFGAADVFNYAVRTIEARVGGSAEFVYRIDYQPDFAENETLDMGYYNVVSGGKIYLAKAAGEGDNTLGLNINAGNENVALPNLSYSYSGATGKVAFKDASLKGATISVRKINGQDIVMIEVDPTAYGIATAKFGYQIKTNDFSTNYYAVSGNTVVKAAIASTESAVITEGSCMEKGLVGAMNRTTVGNEEVAFITNLTQFGGSHKFASLAAGQKCQLCGEEVSRARFNNVGALTLGDNEFIEVTDSYANSGFANIYNGVTLKLTVGSDWYWFRNDGYIGLNDYGVAAVGENVWSSLGDDTRTPNGKLDGDGEEIGEQSFMDAMKAGATFRIWAGYQDGTFTLVWRLYKKGDANQVTGYGTVYYEFTHKIKNITADTLSLAFGLDNATNAGNSSNLWWFKSGTIEKSMIESAKDFDDLALTVGNIEGGFATVSATGGNAMTIDEEGRGDIDAKFVKGVGVVITLKDSYSVGNAFGKVYSDAECKNEVEGARIGFENNNKVIGVEIFLTANQTPGVYYLDLGDNMGSTKQVDIKLDLTAVSISGTRGTVTNNAAIISGGTVEIKYTDLPANLAAKVAVNGTEVALAPSMTIEGVKTASWNNDKLTLDFAPQTNLTGIPQYTVALLDAEGNTVVTNVFTLTALPTSIEHGFVREDGVYGYAEGNTMYLYLIGEKATGTDYLTFNANFASSDKTKVLPYDLAFSLSGMNVSFKTANALTTNKVTAKHFAQGNEFKVTQMAIDLSALGINADTEYYFDVLTANITGSATYYTVNASRVVTPTEVTTLGTKQPIVQNDCSSVGSKGYEIKNGNTVVGYYAVEVVPSHTYAQHATDATLFECSVCHAILASGNATGKVVPLPKNGDDSIVESGISVSFVSSGVAGDWGSFILQPKDTGFALTLPNFDQWNHTVASANVSAELKAEAAKYKNSNGVPTAADKMNGHEWDAFINNECYVTITISKTDGIKYYKNGVLAISYATDKTIGQGDCGGFAATFLGLTEVLGLQIAKSGCHADDALVQRGILTEDQAKARYEIYAAEKAYLPKPHTHAYGANHLCTVCGALDPKYDYPTYTTDTSFTLGTDGTQDGVDWTGYTPTTGKYFKVEQGKKLTIEATMKSQAVNNWDTPLVSVFSGKAMVSGIFRGDNYAIDGDVLKENEGWNIASNNSSASDWNAFKAIIADCTFKLEIDWTNTGKIVVKETFTKTGDTTKTATQTYTITPATGKTFLEQYSMELGFESCYLNVTGVTTTEA